MNKICIANFQGKSGQSFHRIQGTLRRESTHTVLIELPIAFRKKKKYVKRHKKKHDVSIIG